MGTLKYSLEHLSGNAIIFFKNLVMFILKSCLIYITVHTHKGKEREGEVLCHM